MKPPTIILMPTNNIMNHLQSTWGDLDHKPDPFSLQSFLDDMLDCLFRILKSFELWIKTALVHLMSTFVYYISDRSETHLGRKTFEQS